MKLLRVSEVAGKRGRLILMVGRFLHVFVFFSIFLTWILLRVAGVEGWTAIFVVLLVVSVLLLTTGVAIILDDGRRERRAYLSYLRSLEPDDLILAMQHPDIDGGRRDFVKEFLNNNHPGWSMRRSNPEHLTHEDSAAQSSARANIGKEKE